MRGGEVQPALAQSEATGEEGPQWSGGSTTPTRIRHRRTQTAEADAPIPAVLLLLLCSSTVDAACCSPLAACSISAACVDSSSAVACALSPLLRRRSAPATNLQSAQACSRPRLLPRRSHSYAYSHAHTLVRMARGWKHTLARGFEWQHALDAALALFLSLSLSLPCERSSEPLSFVPSCANAALPLLSAPAHRIATASCEDIDQRARCSRRGNTIDGSEACMRASCALLSLGSVQRCLCSLDCMRALVQFAVSISLFFHPRNICARLLRGSTLRNAPDR